MAVYDTMQKDVITLAISVDQSPLVRVFSVIFTQMLMNFDSPTANFTFTGKCCSL